MQAVDYTTLVAALAELRRDWLPARLEQVYQRDRHTVCLALRTIDRRGWLTISWHPQAARLHMGAAPPRDPDTFTFSQQLLHQLRGLALVAIADVAPWERVADLQFASRPGDPIAAHLYAEVMGKYSNLILTDAAGQIVTAAHQVSAQQSSVRPIQTGQTYDLPPSLTAATPSATESFDRWQARVALIPDRLDRQLLKTYRGLSAATVRDLLAAAAIPGDRPSQDVSAAEWARLWRVWLTWLAQLAEGKFQPAFLTPDPVTVPESRPGGSQRSASPAYTVLANLQALAQGGENQDDDRDLDRHDDRVDQGDRTDPAQIATVQDLLQTYYGDRLERDRFQRLHQQLSQKVKTAIAKLVKKRDDFLDRLGQVDQADRSRTEADLLMAHLSVWQPGLSEVSLADFVTAEPVKIKLDPTLNAVQNAQKRYKTYQKLMRSRAAIQPLLDDVLAELAYLEQVDAALADVDRYTTADDLLALAEIQEELIDQAYLEPSRDRPGLAATNPPKTKGNRIKPGLVQNRNQRPPTKAKASSASKISKTSDPRHPPTDEGDRQGFHRYPAPNGGEIWVGRNNAQNDRLTFRLAGQYDLWFHAQEIPGSHVLLRLPPGAATEASDLQAAADLAAFHSRARHSEAVPVVYTTPDRVYKPKGAKPGLVVYKNEQVLWGNPQRGADRRTGVATVR